MSYLRRGEVTSPERHSLGGWARRPRPYGATQQELEYQYLIPKHGISYCQYHLVVLEHQSLVLEHQKLILEYGISYWQYQLGVPEC
jgi:hypothetical protein